MKKEEVFKTINIIVLALLIGYIIFDLKWLLFTALVMLGISLLGSKIAATIAQYWMKFALLIGTINSKILLSVVFYLILVPIALLYRVFNREIVNHFTNNQKKSLFYEMNKTYTKDIFEKPW